MKSASLRAGYRFSKMQAVANVNTGLVEVCRSSDYCIVAAVTLVYELAVIRTHSPNRVTDEHDAAVLTHEPLPIVAEMMEHSVVRSERERRGANRDALAPMAGGGGSGTLARQSPSTLILGCMAEICE